MDESPKKPSDKRRRSDNEKLSGEIETYQTSRMDKKTYSRRDEITAEYAVAGFRKVVAWASLILVPIASILTFYNLVLSKIQKIISDETRVQESRVQRLEHDNEIQDQRIRELEKK